MYKYHCRECNSITVTIYCEGKNLYNCPKCNLLEHTDVVRRKYGN